MKRKKLARSIREMPRSAYIFLRFVLTLCCLMLFASFVLFMLLEQRPADHGLRMTAVLLLENPAGLLIVGGIGLAFILDHSS